MVKQKKRWICIGGIVLAAVVLVASLAVFLLSQTSKDKVKLHITFDEGSGNSVADASGHLAAGEVQYLYDHAVYKEKEEPQWRANGVSGGALLFDGNSTYISYKASELLIQGEELTISVWVAPRAFEWDDPEAQEKGTETLTAIAGQYDKEKKQGVLLGYQRFGKLCFQVGTGEEWYTLWSEDARLERYAWNQVTAVFDGKKGTMELRLNGETVASEVIAQNSAIAPAEKEKFLIGKNADATSIAAGTYGMFSGLMDELVIYESVRGEEEQNGESLEAPEIAFADIWLENILQDDIYKTQYHGGPYQFWMNEPHAPVYYNGTYHLFYQSNIVGTYWRNICWGHLVSTDLVNWEPIREAIVPMEGSVVPDGVWSGGAITDVNGVPVLFFTAGNDSYRKEGLISNQNIGVAYPEDLSDPNLTEWIVGEELAVVQQEGMGRAGEFRDPTVWKEGDTWCMLICSGSTATNGGTALLYESDTLEVLPDGSIDMEWKYMGPVYEMDNPTATYGTSWELPIILPLTNDAGSIRKHIFIMSPAPASTADNKIYYFLGDFDVTTGKFTPDETFEDHPGILDYGTNVFTGPSAFVDPVSGEVCLFSIMQDQRNGAEEGAAGWAHCVGLTRKLWLNDEGTDVKMSPIDQLQNLETTLVEEENLSLDQANALLAEYSEDMYHLEITVDVQEATGIKLLLKSAADRSGVTLQYEVEERTIRGVTTNAGKASSSNQASGYLELEEGCIYMDIYVDRSLVEAFFNETKSLSIRDYGDANDRGIYIESEGEVGIRNLKLSRMNSIY